MIALLVAVLVALGHGATGIRVPAAEMIAPEVYERGPAVIVEWTGPGCGTFEDEPCYVIVRSDLGGIEVGP